MQQQCLIKQPRALQASFPACFSFMATGVLFWSPWNHCGLHHHTERGNDCQGQHIYGHQGLIYQIIRNTSIRVQLCNWYTSTPNICSWKINICEHWERCCGYSTCHTQLLVTNGFHTSPPLMVRVDRAARCVGRHTHTHRACFSDGFTGKTLSCSPPFSSHNAFLPQPSFHPTSHSVPLFYSVGMVLILDLRLLSNWWGGLRCETCFMHH